MKLKTLIIALAVLPTLTHAVGNQHEESVRPAKATVAAAEATGKLILVISRSLAGTPDILGNRHTSRFLDEHFFIEQQVNPGVQDLYLVYNTQREQVHRVAHEPYPFELAVKIKRALNPDTQYDTMLGRFDNGDRSVAFLEKLMAGLSDAGDRENAPRVMRAYLDTQGSPWAPSTLRLLAKHTHASKDPGFAILMADMDAADDVLGTGKTAEKLASIIFDEAFVPLLHKKTVDLENLTERIGSTYPHTELAHHIDGMPIRFMEMREDWEGLKSALPGYLRTHGNRLSDAMRDYYGRLTGS